MKLFYFAIISLIVGASLRLSYPRAIEFKTDEAYTLELTQKYAHGDIGLPFVGQPSSNGLRHPGMGLWPFLLAGKWFGANSPESMARVSQILGLGQLILLFTLAYFGFHGRARIYLVLSSCLLAVSPFWVLQERKGWHPSTLGFFEAAFLLAWRFRGSAIGAFFAGALALIPGQLHMSGFFFTLGFLGLPLLFRFRFEKEKIRLIPFCMGIVLSALPLVPWFFALVTEPNSYPMSMKWTRLLELKFLNYWWSNSYSLMAKFPFGDATLKYLQGPAGIAILILSLFCLLHIPSHLKRLFFWKRIQRILNGHTFNELTQWEIVTLFGMFGVTFFSFMHIPRYFLLSASVFPLLTMVRASFAPRGLGFGPQWMRRPFYLLWFCQLILTITALHFILNYHGTIPGDFGTPLAVR